MSPARTDRPWLTRVQVTGGFLAGLDLSLASGLNVIIGARGAGKTTLLELIRFALGMPSLVPDTDLTDRSFVRSMLGDGEVILDLAGVGDRPRRVVADAESSGMSHLFEDQSLFIGQDGLEAVASRSQSRARLIDFQAGLSAPPPYGEISTLTLAMQRQRHTVRQFQEELRGRPSLEHDLSQLEAEEAGWRVRLSQEAQRHLADLQVAEGDFRQLSLAHERMVAFQQGAVANRDLSRRIEDGLANWKDQDISSEFNRLVSSSEEAATNLVRHMEGLLAHASLRSAELGSRLDRRRAEIATLRANLEVLERGRGDLAERVSHARLTISRLADVEAQLRSELQLLGETTQRRKSVLADRELEQERRYAEREQVAREVTHALGGRVRVMIDHLGDSSAFSAALLSALQGSGLKYSAIAESLAQSLLPQVLLGYIESGSVDEIATVAEVSHDRAQRILVHLATSENLVKIAEATLGDAVDFFLKDGRSFKPMEQLSTGQKCAAVLPIILTDRTRALFLDQPEDNLDNAFLVANVVGPLVRRSADGAQTIVVTHNPNIPVLGGAENVCAIVSDGVGARIEASGSFRNREVVRAITNLMEGGAEAFRRRARFYRHYGAIK